VQSLDMFIEPFHSMVGRLSFFLKSVKRQPWRKCLISNGKQHLMALN